MSSNSIYNTPEYKFKCKEDAIAATQDIIDDMLTHTVPYNIGANSAYTISSSGPWNSNPYSFTTNNANVASISGAGLHVSSDVIFDGDIKWKGRSLGNMLDTIEKRLAILTPNPAKLEHFESLQKAYQHYKTLEALCEIPEKKDD